MKRSTLTRLFGEEVKLPESLSGVTKARAEGFTDGRVMTLRFLMIAGIEDASDVLDAVSDAVGGKATMMRQDGETLVKIPHRIFVEKFGFVPVSLRA